MSRCPRMSMPGAQEVSGTFWPGRAGDRERKSYFDMQPMMLLFHEGDLEPFLPVLMPTYDSCSIWIERLCRVRVNRHQLGYELGSLFLQDLDLDKATAMREDYLETSYAGKRLLQMFLADRGHKRRAVHLTDMESYTFARNLWGLCFNRLGIACTRL
ncbi:hypothetical protein BG000_010818 [Podila horticola]|nr:hypothetical protein BG000_010818 [Podila horticola]